MNDTLKAAGRIGAELGAAKAELERLRELLRDVEFRGLLTGWEPGLIGQITAALSQQPEPTDTYTSVDMATAAAQGFRDGQAAVEPAPAQDEQSPEQMLSREQIENIARKVHGDCIRLPGATYQHAAEAAVMYTLERIARPAQTEQQPSAAQQILDLIMNECRYWQGRDEARRGGYACLYAAAKEVADKSAPIAQTAPQIQAEVEALRKDAERYRWVSSGLHEAETLASIVNCHGGYAEKVAERVDVYREAAMAAKEPEPEHVCSGCGAKGWTGNCLECIPY